MVFKNESLVARAKQLRVTKEDTKQDRTEKEDDNPEQKDEEKDEKKGGTTNFKEKRKQSFRSSVSDQDDESSVDLDETPKEKRKAK